ncbi:MAG TPA: anthranilate synthase component I, partial [Gemmataceae bacterium]|nr:anthranilate synthase component I [Gemmataceae bacterium]
HVVGDGDGFLFESVEGGERWGRYSFVGRRPLATLTARGRTVETTGRLGLSRTEDGILAAVEALVARFQSPTLTGLPPLHGGLVGYLGYDVVREVERLPDVPADDLGHPDAALVVIGQFCAFDHWRQRIVLVDNVVVPDAPDGVVDAEAVAAAYEGACARLTELASDCTRHPAGSSSVTGELVAAPPPGLEKAAAQRTVEPEEYKSAIGVAKEYIRAGDIFQVVLSQRLETETTARPFDIYRTLRVVNPSPFLFYVKAGPVRLVGSSPEIMARVEGDRVTIRPLAGTRPRGKTEEEDAALAAELVADPKERAEHIMLVDLGRNDVGRVARYGSVQLSDVMTVERYSHVMHLCSTVTGRLQPGKTAFDALRSCLPAGTLSGAPKVRAMEIIDELEPHRRGPYGGAVGYVDFSGNMDTCIALRTMVLKGQTAYLQAGAGIVADSVPEKEREETLNKAKGLLRALEMAETQL